MMYASGWVPDLPDFRDYDAAVAVRADTGQMVYETTIRTRIDLRHYCSPIEHQGRLGSCTAQAVAGLVEFYERVIYGRHIDVSRLFLYKVARQLDSITGDNGSRVRTCMKAIRLFGAPPEQFWPYDVSRFDDEPSPFVFAYGQSLQAIGYFRLDTNGQTRTNVLELAKRLIAANHPIVFGFRIYGYGNARGEFPMPADTSRPLGGHAVMAVGYDDGYKIGTSHGALLIRNSWGTNWGDEGYGWLPYEYVTRYLSSDFWTLLQKENVTD